MRFWQALSGFFLGCTAFFLGCSSENSDSKVSGIEIGNPALALTADFSIDYSTPTETKILTKDLSNEPVLIDTFSLALTELRSYSSYYVSVSVDPVHGFQLWPYESDLNATLSVPFVENYAVEDAFSEIDLQVFKT